MARLTVHPKDLTPQETPVALATMGLGLLNKAVTRTRKRKINGDWSLSLSYPANLPEASLLEAENLIECMGQLYRIERTDEKNTTKGRVITVEAPHLFYDLDHCHEITNIETAEDDNYPDGITAAQALAQLLAGTPFAVGTVDVPEKLDYLEVLQKTPLNEIKGQLLDKWGGELQPDNWTVHLRGKVGFADRKYRISHRRNTNDVRCIVDIKPVITRLHVAGADGATFEDINGGLDYIDSPNSGLYARPRHGRITFDDIDDPAELLAKGWEYIDTVDKPAITLEVKLANLKGSPLHALYKNLETFDLGDTAVYDHPKYGPLEIRMVEQEQDVYTEENLSVVLGTPKQNILSSITTAQASADTLARLLTGKGGIRGNKITGEIDLMKVLLSASASYQNAEVIAGKGILLENTNPESPDYGATYHGPGIDVYANSKLPDGSWDFKTFRTADGTLGDEIKIKGVNGVKISVGGAITDAQTAAGNAASAASSAANAASAAQTSANTANNKLTDIASDSKLTAAEKQAAKKEWDVIVGEKAKIDSQADTYGLSKTAYGGAYTALNSYLNAAGTGLLLNLATTSDISGSYFRSIFTDYYNARQDLLNAISAKAKQLADNAQGKANEAYSKFEIVPGMITAEVSGPRDTAAYAKAMADAIAKMSTGNWVYQDPVFKEGLNDVSVYNNADNGVVQISRIAKPADCPAVSTHCLQIQHTGLAAPDLGGFVQPLWSRPNAVFVVKYLAKLPTGYTLVKASNAMGDNWTDNFIGQAVGTGKWEEYVRVIRCGATGTFSLGGHVYVTGPTPSVAAPLVWQLGAIYAYDASEANSIPSRVSDAEFKLRPDQILLAIAEQSHVVLTPEAVEILGGIIRFMSNELDFILLKNGLEALQINTDGISSSLPISSPSILSPSVLGVYRGAQSVAWSGAINASLGNVAKYIPYETYLNVPAGTYQENIIIDGYCGNMLTLFFTGNTTIEGGVIIRNCSSKIRLINSGSGTVTILHGANSGVDAPVYQVGCNLTVSGIRVTGKPRPVADAGSGVGVHAMEGAVLMLTGCTIERTNGYGVLGEINCFIDMYQCRGGTPGGNYSSLQNLGSGALVTRGSILNLYETCPLGATQAYGYWQAPIPTGTPMPTASVGEAPAITTRTLTYNAAFGGTVYPGSTGGWEWMSSDTFSSAWQTNNTTYGDRMPVWGLSGSSGIAAAIGSDTVLSARLKIQRGTAWGDSGPVVLHLKYHGYADRAAVVAGTAKPVMVDIADVSFARGETKTIDLPASVLTALKSGACKGFGGSNLTPTLMMVGDVCTLEITVQGGP